MKQVNDQEVVKLLFDNFSVKSAFFKIYLFNSVLVI